MSVGVTSDLEDIGVSSMFRLIHRVEDLGRMCPTFDLNCEENVTRTVLVVPLSKLNS